MEDGTPKRQINYSKLAEFLRDPSFEPLEKAIVVDLILYAGTKGTAFPNQKTLAKDLNRGDRQIRNALVKLRKSGKLDWYRRGFSKSNEYFLEEFYFRNEGIFTNSDRKPASVDFSNLFPVDTGDKLPPNENQLIKKQNNVETQDKLLREKAKVIPPKPKFTPCGKCDQGYVFVNEEPEYCECRERFNKQTKDWEDEYTPF